MRSAYATNSIAMNARYSSSIWFESAQACYSPIEYHSVATDLQKYSEILGWYTVDVETKNCYNTIGCEASGIDSCVSPGYYRVEGTHIVRHGVHQDSDHSESGPFWCS